MSKKLFYEIDLETLSHYLIILHEETCKTWISNNRDIESIERGEKVHK